jgi:hypothetical protein
MQKGKTPTATETIINHEREYFASRLARMNNKELLDYQQYIYLQFHTYMMREEVSLSVPLKMKIDFVKEEFARRMEFFEQNIWEKEQSQKSREII